MRNLTKAVLISTVAVSFNTHAVNVIGVVDIPVYYPQLQASENRSTAYTNQKFGEATSATTNETNRAIAMENTLRTESRQLGAIGMASSAAAASANPTAGKRTAISTGVGYYQGYSALSLGVTHLIHDNIKLYGTVSGTQDGKQGGAVGASFSF